MSTVIRWKEENLAGKASPLPEYRWDSTEDLAKAAGLSDFACQIRSLGKGQYSYPYHFHHNADELFVILSGSGKLRTPHAIQSIEQGDMALFEKGSSGAHQLYNPHEDKLIYLDLRSVNKADVCEYPDTGKVNILPERNIFYKGREADYFEKEENIKEVWSEL